MKPIISQAVLARQPCCQLTVSLPRPPPSYCTDLAVYLKAFTLIFTLRWHVLLLLPGLVAESRTPHLLWFCSVFINRKGTLLPLVRHLKCSLHNNYHVSESELCIFDKVDVFIAFFPIKCISVCFTFQIFKTNYYLLLFVRTDCVGMCLAAELHRRGYGEDGL